MLENISKMKGEETPEEEKTEETTEKVDTSKIEKMKTGGAKREISGYTPKKEEEGESKEKGCDSLIDDYAPSMRLNNEQNPEIEDFQIGDEVTITAFVTGMEYRTEKGETRCNITLSLKEK